MKDIKKLLKDANEQWGLVGLVATPSHKIESLKPFEDTRSPADLLASLKERIQFFEQLKYPNPPYECKNITINIDGKMSPVRYIKNSGISPTKHQLIEIESVSLLIRKLSMLAGIVMGLGFDGYVRKNPLILLKRMLDTANAAIVDFNQNREKKKLSTQMDLFVDSITKHFVETQKIKKNEAISRIRNAEKYFVANLNANLHTINEITQGNKKIIQVDVPLNNQLTASQREEFEKIQQNKSAKYEWFSRLKDWEKDALFRVSAHSPYQDTSFDSIFQSSGMQNIPGIKNARTHFLVEESNKNYTILGSSVKTATQVPYEMPERFRDKFTQMNTEQIIELIREDGASRYKALWEDKLKSDAIKPLIFFHSLLSDTRLGGDDNALVAKQSKAIQAVAESQKYRDFSIIQGNDPVNILRATVGEANSLTSKVGREESWEHVNQLREYCRNFRDNLNLKEFDEIKYPLQIYNLKMMVEADKQLAVLFKQTESLDRNRAAFKSAYMGLLVESMGGTVVSNCKSGKDRTGLDELYRNAMRIYFNTYKQLPSYTDEGKDREHFITIFSSLFNSLKAQEAAAANTPGSFGIKDTARMLDGDIAESLGLSYTYSNERSGMNKPTDVTKNEAREKAFLNKQDRKLPLLNISKNVVAKINDLPQEIFGGLFARIEDVTKRLNQFADQVRAQSGQTLEGSIGVVRPAISDYLNDLKVRSIYLKKVMEQEPITGESLKETMKKNAKTNGEYDETKDPSGKNKETKLKIYTAFVKKVEKDRRDTANAIKVEIAKANALLGTLSKVEYNAIKDNPAINNLNKKGIDNAIKIRETYNAEHMGSRSDVNLSSLTQDLEPTLGHYVYSPPPTAVSSHQHVSFPQIEPEPDAFAIQKSIESAMIANLKQRYPDNTLDNIDLSDAVIRVYDNADGVTVTNVESQLIFNKILNDQLSANKFPDANSDSGNKLLYVSLLATILPQLYSLSLTPIGKDEDARIITAMVIKKHLASKDGNSNANLSFFVREALTDLQNKPNEIEKMLKSNEADSFRNCIASFSSVKVAHEQFSFSRKSSVDPNADQKVLFFHLSAEMLNFQTITNTNFSMADTWLALTKDFISQLQNKSSLSPQETLFLKEMKDWIKDVEPRVLVFKPAIETEDENNTIEMPSVDIDIRQERPDPSTIRPNISAGPTPNVLLRDNLEEKEQKTEPEPEQFHSPISSIEELLAGEPSSPPLDIATQEEVNTAYDMARQFSISSKSPERGSVGILPTFVTDILNPKSALIYRFDAALNDKSRIGQMGRVFNDASSGSEIINAIKDFYTKHLEDAKAVDAFAFADEVDSLKDGVSAFDDNGNLTPIYAKHLSNELRQDAQDLLKSMTEKAKVVIWDDKQHTFKPWLDTFLGEGRLSKAQTMFSDDVIRQQLTASVSLATVGGFSSEEFLTGQFPVQGFAMLISNAYNRQAQSNYLFTTNVTKFEEGIKEHHKEIYYTTLKNVLALVKPKTYEVLDNPFKNYGQYNNLIVSMNQFIKDPTSEKNQADLFNDVASLKTTDPKTNDIKRDVAKLIFAVKSSPLNGGKPLKEVNFSSAAITELKAVPAEVFTQTVKDVLLKYVEAASKRFDGDKTSRHILKELGIYKFDKSKNEKRTMHFFHDSDMSRGLKSIIETHLSNPMPLSGSYSIPDVERKDMNSVSEKSGSPAEQKYASQIEAQIDPVIPSSRILNTVTVFSSSKKAEFEEIVEPLANDDSRKIYKIRSTKLPIERADIFAKILPEHKELFVEKQRKLYALNSVSEIEAFLKTHQLAPEAQIKSTAHDIHQQLNRDLRQSGSHAASIPSDDYLIYADRQIQTFLAKSGAQSLIKVSKGYDPLLAETFVLLCLAKGLRCDTSLLDSSIYNADYVSSHKSEIELVRSKMGVKNVNSQLLVSKVLDVNLSELNGEITQLKQYSKRSNPEASNLKPYVKMITKIEKGVHLSRAEQAKLKEVLENSPRIFNDLLEKKKPVIGPSNSPRPPSPMRGG